MSTWLGVVRRHPLPLNAAVAAVLLAVAVSTAIHGLPELPRGQAAGAMLAAAVACGALLLRHRWPLTVLVVTIGGAEAYLTQPEASAIILAVPLIALYTVADTAGWRRALTVAVPVVLVLSTLHLLFRPAPQIGPGNLTLAALGGLAVAAGEASRSRRAYVHEVEERARQAERRREQEAARRVTDERLRLARDLHDVLGHQLALINVQARVAAQVLDGQPARARQSLDHITQASRLALDGLKDTIGLLRQPGDVVAPTAPTAGLSVLDDLVASFGRSGLRVERTLAGPVRPVPAAADLTAYRVIQESLTNVSKHAGTGTATVRLGYEPGALRIVVEDGGLGGRVPYPGSPCGHGIAGMRERVSAVGGSLRAGPRPDGGFRVSAWLPLPEAGPDD